MPGADCTSGATNSPMVKPGDAGLVAVKVALGLPEPAEIGKANEKPVELPYTDKKLHVGTEDVH